MAHFVEGGKVGRPRGGAGGAPSLSPLGEMEFAATNDVSTLFLFF